jgi:hypothetical protein
MQIFQKYICLAIKTIMIKIKLELEASMSELPKTMMNSVILKIDSQKTYSQKRKKQKGFKKG